MFDPRESPLRPGDFDLNKQERIAARNARLFEREKQRELMGFYDLRRDTLIAGAYLVAVIGLIVWVFHAL